jgi:hypothetical protein
LELVRLRDSEVASGDRVLTRAEEEFRDETLLREEYLAHWRSRQPGNINRRKAAAEQAMLHTTTPLAGQKRAAEEIRESTENHEPQAEVIDTPSKRQRTETPARRRTETPVYRLPVPGEPNYRHVNEERGTSANAPGSSPEPSERTRGWSVAVPDDSDEDEDMNSEPLPPKVPINPSNWIGIPDDFYDSDSDSDEEMGTPEQPTPAAAVTPYAHKYTPAKPSGLRAVETAASSPSLPVTSVTPPQSPTISPFFANTVQQYLADNPPQQSQFFDWVQPPHIECDDLVQRVGAAYKDMLMKRNGIAA